MSRVYITQALCPKRHCIFALSAETEDFTSEAEQEAFRIGGNESLRLLTDSAIAEGTINPWCGICHAPREDWIFETGPTKWRTMAEARPELERVATEQVVTRAHFAKVRHKVAEN